MKTFIYWFIMLIVLNPFIVLLVTSTVLTVHGISINFILQFIGAILYFLIWEDMRLRYFKEIDTEAVKMFTGRRG